MQIPGRIYIQIEASVLIASGFFALYLCVSRQFLPHDVAFLGLTAEQLCSQHGCRVVHFMIHDRATFGGTLIALGLLYFWIAKVPSQQGQAWAWNLLLVSGIIGFSSFLAYLGYGYLDTWHGIATLALLPCHAIGLIRMYPFLQEPRGIRGLFVLKVKSLGPWLLLLTASGLIGAGLVIAVVGMTIVFVPEDMEFMQLDPAALTALSSRLIPLIAHDRAGFGGALCSLGIALAGCINHGSMSRGLWWVLVVVGLVGFGATLLVHIIIGYHDLFHLSPAIVGTAMFGIGLLMSRP